MFDVLHGSSVRDVACRHIIRLPARVHPDKQFVPPLRWFRTLIRLACGFVERYLDVRSYVCTDVRWETVSAATPWSLSGVLLVNSKRTENLS